MQDTGLTLEGFIYRWLAAVALVLGTYNASEFSFVSWVRNASPGDTPFLLFVGGALLIGYVFFIRATIRSLGIYGMSLLAIIFLAGIWSLIELGVIDFREHSVLLYAVLFSIATVMAIGVSWSYIRADITGQVDINA